MLDRDTVALAILQAILTNKGALRYPDDEEQLKQSFALADRFQVHADRAQFRDPPVNDAGMSGGVQVAATPIHPSEEVVGNKITPADGRLYRRESTGDVFYVPMGCHAEYVTDEAGTLCWSIKDADGKEFVPAEALMEQWLADDDEPGEVGGPKDFDGNPLPRNKA